MTDRSWWREPAILLAPLAAFAAWFYSQSDLGVDWYVLGRARSANDAVIALGPYVAAIVAWEMGTLRRVWGRLAVRRPWWRVLAARMALPVTVALVILVAIYAVMLAGLPTFASPGWSIPALSVANVLGWALFGAALGLVLGPVLSLPAALIVPFLVLAVPRSWSDPLWARHVTGLVDSCCDPSEVYDTRALTAGLAFLAVIAVASLCVAAIRLAPARSGIGRPVLALGIVVAAIAGGLFVGQDVRQLGLSSSAPRNPDAVRCYDGNVCLWPEETFALEANVQAWKRVRAAWIDLGLPEPPVVIGPRNSGMPLPITIAVPDMAGNVEDAEVSLVIRLPAAMRGCFYRNYGLVTGTDNDPTRFEILSSLLRARLGLPTGGPLPVTADQASQIWSQTQQCEEGQAGG
ncbi:MULTISPECIES: hypothetical protein [Parafrankia]|uniref:hypothetical protein n=1 Tax=Parafrankia TaxID=2994362 RepID=UPI000B8A4EB8|nr:MULTISPECIES: hypothetical protein [Parafrankia]MBE3203871.1 hypothetical protein [Parafrankia sp. CH37]